MASTSAGSSVGLGLATALTQDVSNVTKGASEGRSSTALLSHLDMFGGTPMRYQLKDCQGDAVETVE
jgi:hypothetical protein